jgi:hypothetical protein
MTSSWSRRPGKYRDERIEIGWDVHDTLDAARAANHRAYGNKPDEVEEWF